MQIYLDTTNFYFLREGIEAIQVVAPTLSSMGSPIVVMTLRPGRGEDARHGAKTRDQEGWLKFNFQSFVSFSVAHRCEGSPELQRLEWVFPRAISVRRKQLNKQLWPFGRNTTS